MSCDELYDINKLVLEVEAESSILNYWNGERNKLFTIQILESTKFNLDLSFTNNELANSKIRFNSFKYRYCYVTDLFLLIKKVEMNWEIVSQRYNQIFPFVSFANVELKTNQIDGKSPLSDRFLTPNTSEERNIELSTIYKNIANKEEEEYTFSNIYTETFVNDTVYCGPFSVKIYSLRVLINPTILQDITIPIILSYYDVISAIFTSIQQKNLISSTRSNKTFNEINDLTLCNIDFIILDTNEPKTNVEYLEYSNISGHEINEIVGGIVQNISEFCSFQFSKPQVLIQSDCLDVLLFHPKHFGITISTDINYEAFSFNISLNEYSMFVCPYSLLISENKQGIVWYPESGQCGIYKPILFNENSLMTAYVKASQKMYILIIVNAKIKKIGK